ncbi:hypothetical protein ACHAXS_007511 [Conticribra weissflogii]
MITGVEFYTEITDNVEFELWSRRGTFKDHKGTYEGWDLIASGTVRGRGLGRYTSIPDDLFTPISINGGGGEAGTRAFYLTLHSINLVYTLGDGQDSDMVAHAANQDLEIYEGEGVLSYPFPDPSDVYFYRYPRQFLGAISYDRLPCKPYSAYGPIVELPCPLIPTSSPTELQPTKVPVTNTPTAAPTSALPSAVLITVAPTLLVDTSLSKPTDELSFATASPTSSPITPTSFPTFSVTFSLSPTNAPTTPSPTSSPIVPMRANIVLTLANTPERPMTDRELNKFMEITKDFLIRHTQQSMVVERIDYWHQELTTMEQVSTENPNIFDGDDETEFIEPPPQAVRGTREKGTNKKKNQQPKKEKIPQVHSTRLTLIMRVTHSNLPLGLIGKMATVSIDEKQTELLSLLNEQSAFYSYFKNINAIIAKTIDTVSYPPSLSPTSYEEFSTKQTAKPFNDEEDVRSSSGDAKERNSFGLFVGLGIGAIWCCLTIITICYLLRVRSELKNEKKLERLSKQEKSNNIYNVAGEKECKMIYNGTETISLDCDEEKRCEVQTIDSEITPSHGDFLSNCETAIIRPREFNGKSVSISMQPPTRSIDNRGPLRRVTSSRDLRFPNDIPATSPAVNVKISNSVGAARTWKSQSLTLPRERPRTRERVGLAQSAVLVPSSRDLGVKVQHNPMAVSRKTPREDLRGRNSGLSKSEIFLSSTATTRTPTSIRSSRGRNTVAKSMNAQSSKFLLCQWNLAFC